MQHPLQCLCAFHDQNGHLYLAAAAGRHIVLYALQPASQSVLAEAADYQLKQSPPSRFLFAEVQEHATASLGSAPITSLLRNRGELIALCPATKSVLTYELTPSQLREIFSTHEGVSCASGTEPSFNHSISPRSNSLSKRPCAATQIPSSNLLAVADKFGDVYVLPKHSPQAGADAQTQDAPELKIRSNAPAANHLTVHSQRNRRALREQRRRVAVPADSGSNIKPHSPPNSSPLLGHVSMLADVEATHAMGQNLLITADRDEHVRISSITNEVHRARSFCLGHLTFLCKVCFLSSKEDGLISGDGDAYLHVWKATAGRLLQSFDLQRIVDEETYLLYPDSTTCTDTNQAYSSASSASTSPRKRKYSVHRIMSLRLPNAQFPSVGAETQEQIVVSMQKSVISDS